MLFCNYDTLGIDFLRYRAYRAGVFNKTLFGLLCALLGFLGGMVAVGHSQSLRFEMGAGLTQHQLAPEGSWWYDGFDKHTKLLVGSWKTGFLWTPIKSGEWDFGVRGGYADLGKTKAENSFPVFEDGSSRDARVNPNCDHATFSGCVGRFDGQGHTKGWYLGPALEYHLLPDMTLSAELGAYVYRSDWIAKSFRIVDPAGGDFTPVVMQGVVWNNAKATHVTPYIGGGFRFMWFTLDARFYNQVHASNMAVNKDFIGMTSGPVWSLMAGFSIPLQ